MANSVDPDETAHYDPSHQDLHGLQKHVLFAGLKELNSNRLNIFFSL